MSYSREETTHALPTPPRLNPPRLTVWSSENLMPVVPEGLRAFSVDKSELVYSLASGMLKARWRPDV